MTITRECSNLVIRERDTWRSIDSAPRDGQHIIAADLTPGRIGFGRGQPWTDVVHWFVDGFYASSFGGNQPTPYDFLTHWMPIPLELRAPVTQAQPTNHFDSERDSTRGDSEREALSDMLDDARRDFELIRDALGVSYEPHQTLFERTLDAARSHSDVSAARDAPIDVEAMLVACVPGGDVCDPQIVADEIRAWFDRRAPRLA